jgi:pyrimidine-specific ribonucleoside hydrolase
VAWALVCDPGIDDAVALAVLVGLGAPPDLVVAVPGNVGLEATTRNAVGLAGLLGLDVPVRTFADAPSRALPEGKRATHGEDGLGGVAGRLPAGPPPSPLDLHELPHELLVTGPLSCAAAAPSVERLVWMGGGLTGGNVTPIAEFNAWCDPEATDRVLAAGVPTQVVPLEITRQVPLTDDHVDELARGSDVARLVADALRARDWPAVHDAVAAVAWIHPELFTWEPMALRCEPSGALVPADGRPPVEVAVEVDVDAVRALIGKGVLGAG